MKTHKIFIFTCLVLGIPWLTGISAAEPKETARDGSFITYDNSVVVNTKTGLEWFVGPDKNTNWYEAKSWIDSLTLDGGGWRMPTREELEGLFKDGLGTRNMTPLLKTTGWRVWSSLGGYGWTTALAYNFTSGIRDWREQTHSDGFRAFAVRSRRG